MYEREQSTNRVWGPSRSIMPHGGGKEDSLRKLCNIFRPVFCDLTPLFIKLLLTFGLSFSASFPCVRMQGTFLFVTVWFMLWLFPGSLSYNFTQRNR